MLLDCKSHLGFSCFGKRSCYNYSSLTNYNWNGGMCTPLDWTAATTCITITVRVLIQITTAIFFS